MAVELDEIGPWSEIKLDILRAYAGPYSQILQANGFHHGYIDAFSGPGLHVRKGDHQEVLGSPLVALGVTPRFDEYHFIDLDGEKVDFLRSQVGKQQGVHLHHGDSNDLLIRSILPHFTYTKRTRALCVLDPYKLTLDWRVLQKAGASKAVEVFINFPVMHMNRNCKHEDLSTTVPGEVEAMDRFWGDRSWHGTMFQPSKQMGLFGSEELAKSDNDALVSAYCQRLKDHAGFGFVSRPLPMKNSKNAVVYYLVFAGPNETGWKIVRDIFKKYS